MSKKHHNRSDAAADSGKSQPSNVTLDDLQDDEPKKRVGPPVPEVERQPLARALTEFLLIFAIFFLYGAWPVPDTNEPYYVGKAMHAWHSETFKNDVFFNSHDTHWLFYKTFGWLTLYMGLDAATWVGRSVLWLALAFGWYRLSRVVVPIAWASVISALVFACFMVKFQMAGEWIIGGIEGKVFAYVFVFLGLDALARNRWNLMWVLFGIAATYHPIVGGWSVIAGAVAWLLQRRTDRMPLKRMLLPLLIGGAISLIGVVPGVMMDLPPKTETAQQDENPNAVDTSQQNAAVAVQAANSQNTATDAAETAAPDKTASKFDFEKIKEKAWYVAVFKRLSHHELPYAFRSSWVIRLSLLAVAWLLCAAVVWGRKTIRPDDPQAVPDNEPIMQPPAPPGFRVACFIVGTILISCAGFIIAYGLRVPIPDENDLPDKAVLAAKLLRFYWFRMTDFTIPLGMALCGTAILYRTIERCRRESYTKDAVWWVNTLGVSALGFVIVYGLAFLCFANFCPPIRFGLSYDLLTMESETLAYGVVVVAASALLFWFRNDSPQPDRAPTRPMFMLLAALLIVFGAAVPMLLDMAEKRLHATIPRTVLYNSPNNFQSWREMCDWIAENTEEDAVFLVPKRDESFKWYAKRANVSTWKEMPQDAASMVRWYDTMNDCYALNLPEEEKLKINEKLAPLSLILLTKSRGELIALQDKYRFTYILSEQKPALDLPIVHQTEFYILYRADAQTLNPQNLQFSGATFSTPAPMTSSAPTMSFPPAPTTPMQNIPAAPPPGNFPAAAEPGSMQQFNGGQNPRMNVPTFLPGN